MREYSSLNTVTLVAVISSAVQGIVWCILSLLGIFCYVCILIPGRYTYNNEFRFTYKHYLAAYFQGSCDKNLDFYKNLNEVTSSEKVLFMDIIVFIFNFIMAIVSFIVIFVLMSKRKRLVFGWLVFYLVITFCVAVLDMICTGVVASDYFAVTDLKIMDNGGLAGLSLIVLMLITSRGILIWVANLAFSLYLITFLCRKEENQALIEMTDHKEDNTSTRTKSDSNFIVDKRMMENKPIVIISPEKYEKNPFQEYPSYTAYSRWPRLHPDNKVSRPNSFAAPNATEQQERQLRQQKVQQELQKELLQNRPQQRPPPPPQPPVKPIYRVPRENANDKTNLRPGSLQEAILTVRPLRPVRPRITAIPDGY